MVPLGSRYWGLTIYNCQLTCYIPGEQQNISAFLMMFIFNSQQSGLKEKEKEETAIIS